jgi:hypothetical protein
MIMTLKSLRFYYDIPDTDEHHNATDDSDEHSTSKLHFSSSSFSRNLITVLAGENLGPEFSIETWAVANRCKGPLEDLVSSHDIQPLPAYDEKHVLIPPFQYESKLKGALVEVHITAIASKGRNEMFSMLYCVDSLSCDHLQRCLRAPSNIPTSTRVPPLNNSARKEKTNERIRIFTCTHR